MNRRDFLRAASITATAAGFDMIASGEPLTNPQIIDSHIHLFDPSRPEGVPWPPKNSTIYRSTLPAQYRELAKPFGVTGAIAIECSPWLADNEWLLNAAKADPIMVGVIGDLEPGTPDFRKQLATYHKNPLFLGIRYGNLWGRDLGAQLGNLAFVADLRTLADTGLVLDTANPNPALIKAVVELTDRVPNLTVIVDHLPGMQMPEGEAARKECQADVRRLSSRPRVAAKLSGMLRRVDGKVPVDLASYQDRLNEVWALFGPDRCFYGSDWPNSEQLASYADVFHLTDKFIASQDAATIDKFYRGNAERTYRWKKR